MSCFTGCNISGKPSLDQVFLWWEGITTLPQSSSSPLSSDFSVSSAVLHCFHSFLPSLFGVLPFLIHSITEEPPLWLRGSAVPCVCWLELAGIIHGHPQPLLTKTTLQPPEQHLTTLIQGKEVHRLLDKLQRALSQNSGRIRSQNPIICLIPLNTYKYKKLILN